MTLSILYRGSLASCNYGCEYCPFAKKVDSKSEQEIDEQQLERFAQRIAELAPLEIAVFFTPWGEALIHSRYQRVIARLSKLPNVSKVAIQTNLSCSLDWLSDCNVKKLGIWATYHPGEVALAKFTKACEKLNRHGITYSVGVVGLKDHFDAIAEIRAALPTETYVWINAYKREQGYYSPENVEFLRSVDPYFEYNNMYHDSLGRACRCGDTVISVDGNGDIRRCHFIQDTVANFYDESFMQRLIATPCTASKCGCHIGYVHMNDLPLYDIFGDGVLERVPAQYRSKSL